MIVELHAHYPMHLSAASTLARMTDLHRSGWGDRIRALVLALANRVANYPASGQPAVTVPNLKAGDVGVILSVLYQPVDEIDLNQPYGAPPLGNYFTDLEAQIAARQRYIPPSFTPPPP